MEEKKMNKKSDFYLLKYEFKNNLNNGYSFFFGALFPLLLLFLISRSITSDVPQDLQKEVMSSLFLTMSMIVPLASMFLGYSATYANELEKNVPLRLNLFGIKQSKLFFTKLKANYIFLTFCLLVFCLSIFIVKIQIPTIPAFLVWLLVIYIFSAFLIALAHGLATLIGTFGPTYGVAMGIYFLIMILSGMMGMSVTDLPEFIQPLARLLPPTQIGLDFVDFWMGKSYNFAPLIQSLIFFGAISLIVLLLSFRKKSRKNS